MSAEKKRGKPGSKPGTARKLNKAFTTLTEQLAKNIAENGGIAHDSVDKPNLIDTTGFDAGEYAKFPTIYTYNQTNWLELDELEAPHLAVPIGEYGPEWTNVLFSTAVDLAFTAESDMSPANINLAAKKIKHIYRRVIADYTAYKDPMLTMRNAFYDLSSLGGALTVHQVDGYEGNPFGLMHDLVENGEFSKFALTVPPGVTAEVSGNYMTFVDPVVVNENTGKPEVRKDILRHFRDEKDGFYRRHWDPEDIITMNIDLDGCPAARKQRGQTRSVVDIVGGLMVDALAQNMAQ